MGCRVSGGMTESSDLTDTVRDGADVGCDGVGVVVVNVFRAGVTPVCRKVVHCLLLFVAL